MSFVTFSLSARCWWREAQEIPSISDLRGKKEMSVGGVEEGVKEVEIRGAKTRLG